MNFNTVGADYQLPMYAAYPDHQHQYPQGQQYNPHAPAAYYQNPPQMEPGYAPQMNYPPQYYYTQPQYHPNHANPQPRGYVRGNHRARGHGRGRGSNSYRDHQGRNSRYHNQQVNDPTGPANTPTSNDPNIDEESQYVSQSESFSRKAQFSNQKQPSSHARSRYQRYSSDNTKHQFNNGQEFNRSSRTRHQNYVGDTNGTAANSEQNDREVYLGKNEQAQSRHPAAEGYARNDSRKSANANTRSQRSNVSRGQGNNRTFKAAKHNMPEDIETQRDSLIEHLSRNSYECMVCCEIIRREAHVWNCQNCFHVYHLPCIKKWARSSTATDDGWRCPACQNVNSQFPYQYRCYCGKVKDPDPSRFEVPHSCGDVCKKKRPHECIHPCNILCHPGPCPPCAAMVTKQCDCGRSKQTVKCGQATSLKCSSKCQKTLNCSQHECQRICHSGPCDPCEDEIEQACFCGKANRTVVCGTSESFCKSFSCKQACNRKLECGNHVCERSCHPGVCDSCGLMPSAVSRCPCGKTSLEQLSGPGEVRTKCTDPIPTCDNVCDKELACGPKEMPHTCDTKCHEGACGTCQGSSEVTCRCERFITELPCVEAAKFNDQDPYTCDRRCHKKRQCGKHKCGQLCCVDEEHACDQICGRKLTCGLHRCEERCHRNNCPPCWHVSFEELHCSCGSEIIFPPVPCGTKPPECKKTCTKEHACGHTVRHYCHSDERCPPCTELTKKWCMGHHEMRKNIPCHLVDISCGMPCGKDLLCGMHKCQIACHKGECEEECVQLCPRPREECGHPCGAPCHGRSACPKVSCKSEVVIKCECGNRSERSQCLLGGDGGIRMMETAMFAMTMSNTMSDEGLDLSAIMKDSGKKKPRKLECTPECSLLERNKRLALALEIKNPDVSSKLGNPTYNQFLKDYSKQYTTFVASVERDLSNLVKTAEKSKQLKRSHAFRSMNSNQRRLIHELAEFYGCETQSYDEEPNKNVVATAFRGKCFHPSVTLTHSLQRELHPMAPTPIPHHGKEEDIRSNASASKQSTSVLGAWGKLRPTAPNQATKPAPWGAGSAKPAQKSESSTPTGPAGTRKLKSMSVLKKDGEEKKKPDRSSPVIDYFDMTG